MRTHELWKHIDGHPFYLISTHGNVRSIRSGKIKLLRPRMSGAGYLFVTFSYKGIYSHRSVHSLVYTHFVGSVPIGYEINHKDLNKKNNYYGNLELLTHQENIKHAFDKIMRNRLLKRVIKTNIEK